MGESVGSRLGKGRQISKQTAEQIAATVNLSIDSLSAAPARQKLKRGKVARTCFLGPRLFLDHRGRTADLKTRSALPLLLTTVGRCWKGGASAPPLQDVSEYFCVPRPAQLAAASCAGRGTKRERSRDFGGAKAPPFRQPPFRCGDKCGLTPIGACVQKSADLTRTDTGSSPARGQPIAALSQSNRPAYDAGIAEG